MLVARWPVWVPPRGHTTTTKEEEPSILVDGAAPGRTRHDILIHGKPVVMRKSAKKLYFFSKGSLSLVFSSVFRRWEHRKIARYCNLCFRGRSREGAEQSIDSRAAPSPAVTGEGSGSHCRQADK